MSVPWNQAWGLVPVVVLVFLILVRARAGWLLAVPRGAVLWVLGAWVAMQGLGVWSAITPEVLRGLWLLALGGLVWRCRSRIARRGPDGLGFADWRVRLVWGAGAVLLAITLTRALLSPPNTVDALSYHLPRQVAWLQQGALDFYPTINDRENMMPPLAEVIGMQFLAITGDDYWANLPAWAAYAGAAWVAAGLARVLGAGRLLAAGAGLAVLLLPMSYHEAASAKNDLLAGFWHLALALELVVLARRGSARWRVSDGVWIGLMLAAGWLTKSTTMVIGPVLICAMLVAVGMRRGSALRGSGTWRAVAAGAGVFLVLVAPFHVRNLNWYGTPLGVHREADGGGQAATGFTPSLAAAGVVRHAAVHLLTPWESWNEAVRSGLRGWHRWLGVEEADPRITLWVLSYALEYFPDSEAQAGATAHFLIGVPLLVAACFRPWRKEGCWLAAGVLIAAFLLACAVKWQPWLARLHQGLFFIGIAVAAAQIGAWKWRSAGAFGVVALLVAAWLPGADTYRRSLWTSPTLWQQTRYENYFTQARFESETKRLISILDDAGARVVLVPNIHEVTYPFLRLLGQPGRGGVVGAVPVRGAPPPPVEAIALFSASDEYSLWKNYAGRGDWRLVGEGLTADGIYLPVKRVDELGWRNRLPAFAGWQQPTGLLFKKYDNGNGGTSKIYLWSGGRVSVVVPPLIRGGVLRAKVLTGASEMEVRDVWENDAEPARKVYALGAPNHEGRELVLPLAPKPTARCLTFSITAGFSAAFVVLQVNDSPPSESPAMDINKSGQ